jgi:hypothetical protein
MTRYFGNHNPTKDAIDKIMFEVSLNRWAKLEYSLILHPPLKATKLVREAIFD